MVARQPSPLPCTAALGIRNFHEVCYGSQENLTTPSTVGMSLDSLCAKQAKRTNKSLQNKWSNKYLYLSASIHVVKYLDGRNACARSPTHTSPLVPYSYI